jgi:hypothetical protein
MGMDEPDNRPAVVFRYDNGLSYLYFELTRLVRQQEYGFSNILLRQKTPKLEASR